MLKQWMYGATLSLAMVATATMTGCSSNKPVSQNGVLNVQPITILSRTAGVSDKLTEPEVYLINDAATLQNIGSEALNKIAMDFDTQSLIVLSLGECSTGGYWAHINGVQQLGDTIIVQGIANKPTDNQTQALTYPFEAVVVNKVQGSAVPDITSVEGQKHPSDDVQAVEAPKAPEAKDATKADSDKDAADKDADGDM